MAEKDPLQNSINKLDNTMNTLDKTVRNLTKAFNDRNRTEKSRKVVNTSAGIDDALRNALMKIAPLTKKGTIRKDYEPVVNRLLDSNRALLEKYDKIREYGYNKDNPSNKLSNIYGIKEVQKIVDEILSSLESKRNGISKEDSKEVRQELYGNIKGVSVDSAYKIVQSMNDGSEAILRTAGVFAQVRSEVVEFQRAIHNATKTVSDNLSNSSKRVNDRLSKMATDSKTLKDVVSNLNHTVTRANNSISKFADRLDTAARLIGVNNRRLRGSATSINSLVKKVQKTSNTINNIQNTLSRKNSGSSASGNSFRNQATRNSDRAKQAGFIALLIPALAKLLKHPLATDYLKLVALRYGSGKSGTGERPLAGAIGYMAAGAAPTIITTILTYAFRKKLMAMGGKILESIGLSKGLNHVSSGLLGITKLPRGQVGKYIQGIRDGFNAPRNTFGRQQVLIQGGYATKVPGTAYRDPLNRMRWLHQLQPQTGMVAGNRGFEVGLRLQRILKIPSNGMLSAGALTKSPLLAGLTKAGGVFMKRLPLIGAALDVVGDVSKGKSFGKSALSSAIGTAGFLAGPWGLVLYPLLKGVTDGITGNLDKHSKQWAANKKAEWGWRTGVGAKIIDILAGIGEAFQFIVDPIKGIWEWLKDKFHIGETYKESQQRKQGERNLKDAQKSAKKEVKQIEKDLGTYQNIKDYVESGKKDKGMLWAKERAYNNMMSKFKEEYASTQANGMTRTEFGNKAVWETNHKDAANDWIKNRNLFDAARKSDAANTYAEQKMQQYLASEQHNLQVRAKKAQDLTQFVNVPDNLAVHSINNISAVAMKDLGLQGKIWSKIENGVETGNTLPYIAQENVGKMKWLDSYLAAGGHKALYTSNMGGHTKGGHVKGNKVDIQMGKILKPDEYEYLFNQGVFGGNTGAIGYEYNGKKTLTTPAEYRKLYEQKLVNMNNGNHYDFSVSGGVLNKAATKSETIKELTPSEKTKEQTASSQIREGLADIVGAKDKSAKQDRARNIVLSAVDVTGSLGVWGITQLNNGVMRTGR